MGELSLDTVRYTEPLEERDLFNDLSVCSAWRRRAGSLLGFANIAIIETGLGCTSNINEINEMLKKVITLAPLSGCYITSLLIG